MHDEQNIDLDTAYNVPTKILMSMAAATIMGKKTGIQIKGAPEKLSALESVLKSTKNFYDELNREGATVDSVIDMLKVKQRDAVEFHATLGLEWPF